MTEPSISSDREQELAAKQAPAVGHPNENLLATGHRFVARLLRLIESRGGDAQSVLATRNIDQPLAEFLGPGLLSVEKQKLRAIASYASVVAADMQSRKAGRALFRAGDWRLLFYCLTGSKSLREAIQRMEELLVAIDGRMGFASLNCSGSWARLTLRGARSGDEELDFIVSLHGELMFHSIFSWLIGVPLGGIAALDFPESAVCYLDDDSWPFELRLGAPRSELIFAERMLDLPVLRTMEDCEAAPMLNFLFGLRDGNDPEEIARRSRQLMALALREEARMLSLNELANELVLGRMTLRRRLSAAGTTFHKLRDEVRRGIAVDLVVNSNLPIEEIAERLDFCDSDSLRSAFHAWTGMAPTHYRRSMKPVAQPS
jgi:AraC-like DNA-binding protein